MVNGWNKFLGKNLKIVFDDGQGVSIKAGILKEVTDDYLLIRTSQGEQAISLHRIVRTEVL